MLKRVRVFHCEAERRAPRRYQVSQKMCQISAHYGFSQRQAERYRQLQPQSRVLSLALDCPPSCSKRIVDRLREKSLHCDEPSLVLQQLVGNLVVAILTFNDD